MARRRKGGLPLMGRVWAELGAGRITEAYIRDKKSMCDGLCIHGRGRGHITVNPAHQTIDTVIHEILHRLHPEWTEPYVRNRTRYLRNRMNDGEVQTFYAEYQTRKKCRRTPVTI